ncbi:MAG TPA: penicillin-binding transpeptidase domain-containing protein, partial [Pseudonocardiaceae bacterium]|nr:penicillin-binding transpeptidase domain-containing protein [Pseudonocardiaceae bacterium]
PSAPDPSSAARQYLRALAAGDLQAASALTDSPAAAFDVLADGWEALRPTTVRATLGGIGPGNSPSATYMATWTFRPGHVWSYPGRFELVRIGRNWRVHWTPAALYPTLRAGQRLALVTRAADHPAVVDRDGKPLVIAGAGGIRLADKDFALLGSALVGRVPATSSRTFAIERVDAEGHDLETLFGTATGATKPVRSTLSVAVQSAAQSVVDAYGGDAVIVAVRPSDGGLVAAARNARSGSSPFSGLYAPGSTFKIVTATAALEAGIATEDTALACPPVETFGTRTIRNDGFGLGTVTMHRAFARSCNTTFGQLASRLPEDGLSDAASQFGLNADFDIPGLDTQTGKVVPAAGPVEQVEDGIGQGTVQVSPFGEALMAATVAAGHAVTPRLWRDAATGVATGYTAPPAEVLASLRPMMREVVTSGTATGLAHSGLVYGKTGTAQFGTGEHANGWFVGYRGDLAFAVLLAGANSSAPAVTLAERFLAKVN